MKKRILIYVFLTFTIILNAQNEYFGGNLSLYSYPGGNFCSTNPYILVFNDEFNGNTLDNTKWHTYFPYGPNGSDACFFCRTHTSEGETTEQQVFLDRNVVVANGNVSLFVRKEDTQWMNETKPFSAGMLHSKLYQHRFLRGKYEIRCKLPKYDGLWPSFWLFGGDKEIDVFEFRDGSTTDMQMSLHHWFVNGNDQYVSEYYTSKHISKTDFSKDFHTFAVEWDKGNVTWLVDNIPVRRVYKFSVNSNGASTTANDCQFASGIYGRYRWFPETQNPSHVIAGIGVEENYPQDFTNQVMEIDYIRVYERNNGTYLPNLCQIEGQSLICTTD